MLEAERKIQRQRTILAAQKGYMGKDGKLSLIAQQLGDPIRSSGFSYLANNESDEIPTLDEQDVATHIGWIFDGLNRGLHLTIRTLGYGNEIRVEYRGIVVYEESWGELIAYVPVDDWHAAVTRLGDEARRKQKDKRTQQSKETEHNRLIRTTDFLQRMRQLWGF